MEIKSTDTQLLEQVRNSDMEAFKVLFERYQPIIFRQVLFQTREIDISHDIVQETFIKVWEHRKSIKPNLGFLAYLLRISRNLIFDMAKHQKIRERTSQLIPQIALSENDDPSEALHLTVLQEQITIIINRDLSNRCREIFLLSRFEGKTHKEIAEIFNLSVRTVENQITNALKVLRKKLDRR